MSHPPRLRVSPPSWLWFTTASCAVVVSLAPVAYLAWGAATRGTFASLAAMVDGRVVRLLGKSLGLAGATSVLATVLGVGLAVWVATGRDAARRTMGRLYALPLLVPSYLYAATWLWAASGDGLLSRLFTLLTGRVADPYGFIGSVLILSATLSPLVTWLSLSAMKGVPEADIEAGRLYLGDGRTWFAVLLRGILPRVGCGAALLFVLAAQNYTVPTLLQYNTLSLEVYADFSQRGDPFHAFVVALPYLLAALTAGWAAGFGVRTQAAGRASPKPLSLWKLEAPLSLLTWARASAGAWVFSISAPLLFLLVEGLSSPRLLLRAMGPGSGALFTGATSFVAALSCVGLALPLAWSTRRGGSSLPSFLAVIALALPAPLFGMGVLTLWSRTGLVGWANGLPLFILGHVGRFLPAALLVLSSHLGEVDLRQWEAALCLPIPPRKRFTGVFFPLTAPSLRTAAGIVVALSFGEVGSSLLLCPPGSQTVALKLYTLLHYGSGPAAASVALAAVFWAAVTWAFVYLLLGGWRR